MDKLFKSAIVVVTLCSIGMVYCAGKSADQWIEFIRGDKPIEVVFEYSALDDYYLECMSLHGGTGRVIIRGKGDYELRCADGHKAGDPGHTHQPTPFIRPTKLGRIYENRRRGNN